MEKCFIWWICSTCGEPVSIVNLCEVTGYNNYPQTNFHGELSYEETVELREDFINTLKSQNKDYKLYEQNTKVLKCKILI